MANRGKQGFGIVLVVAFGLAAGLCVACVDDDDNDNESLRPAALELARDKDGDRDRGRNSRADCEGSGYCDERDFSPTFDESPIVICVQPGACDFRQRASARSAPA